MRTIGPMSSLEQIRDSIEARLAQLRTEVSALQSAQAALNGRGATAATTTAATTTAATTTAAPTTAAPTTGDGDGAGSASATPGKPSAKSAGLRRRPRTRRRTKPAAGVLTAGGVETMLRDAPDGLSAVTIAKRSGAGYNQVLGLLRERERAGVVRRTGTRRSTLWRLITDEERIAERAAELERRMAKAGPADSG
jgi:hypothetical protein